MFVFFFSNTFQPSSQILLLDKENFYRKEERLKNEYKKIKI